MKKLNPNKLGSVGSFGEEVAVDYMLSQGYEIVARNAVYDGKEIEIVSDGIYRSLHYNVKYNGYYIEIQGRTLFEEGWGEIDHDIVYPYYREDNDLKDFSKLLNRLSGMADEMSSYFRRMKQEREE